LRLAVRPTRRLADRRRTLLRDFLFAMLSLQKFEGERGRHEA